MSLRTPAPSTTRYFISQETLRYIDALQPTNALVAGWTALRKTHEIARSWASDSTLTRLRLGGKHFIWVIINRILNSPNSSLAVRSDTEKKLDNLCRALVGSEEVIVVDMKDILYYVIKASNKTTILTPEARIDMLCSDSLAIGALM
jgi:hypothetical protein